MMVKVKSFSQGLMTGLLLQLALGPLFFYILAIVMEKGFFIAFFAILAVTLVDLLYISLSILGVGRILEKNKAKKVFGYISSAILLIFGAMFILKGFGGLNQQIDQTMVNFTPLNSFLSCLIMTLSSPLTIVFWSSLFTTKAIEKNYSNIEMITFGIGAGLMTLIFLSSVMFLLSLIGPVIPNRLIQWLNILVGGIIGIYAAMRLYRSIGIDND